MALTREEVVHGIADELAAFEELVRSVDERGWGQPTRCAGWTVADVAAHVTGIQADLAAGDFAGLAAPDSSQRQADERRGRTPNEIADELRGATKITLDLARGFDDAGWASPAPPPITGTVGFGIEGLWYDAYVHADDIRAALRWPSERGAGLRASVHHVAELLSQAGWGPATLSLDGVERIDVGAGGREVAGDPLTFVLVATGRADPAVLGLDESVNVYR